MNFREITGLNNIGNTVTSTAYRKKAVETPLYYANRMKESEIPNMSRSIIAEINMQFTGLDVTFGHIAGVEIAKEG